MYQYQGYRLDYTDSAVCIRDPKDQFVCYCESDAEATAYIYDCLVEVAPEVLVEESDVYFVYRIAKSDKDCYNNYQYYNGRWFQYGLNVKRMTKDRAEAICNRYRAWDSQYVYRVSR